MRHNSAVVASRSRFETKNLMSPAMIATLARWFSLAEQTAGRRAGAVA
jgi:hypothetical protein